jgi:hypothetical protein
VGTKKIGTIFGIFGNCARGTLIAVSYPVAITAAEEHQDSGKDMCFI